jgi:hypothetical protein
VIMNRRSLSPPYRRRRRRRRCRRRYRLKVVASPGSHHRMQRRHTCATGEAVRPCGPMRNRACRPCARGCVPPSDGMRATPVRPERQSDRAVRCSGSADRNRPVREVVSACGGVRA